MWIRYNPNPTGRTTGDCAVRAVCAALGVDWDTAFDMIADMAKGMGEIMPSDTAWGAVLRRHGFYRATIPNRCPDCYTAGDFAADNPRGTYVLGFGGHVATIVDGDIYDAWDSSRMVPVYAWHRKGGG